MLYVESFLLGYDSSMKTNEGEANCRTKLGTDVYCRQRKEYRMKIAVVNKKHSSTEHVLIRAANKKALD